MHFISSLVQLISLVMQLTISSIVLLFFENYTVENSAYGRENCVLWKKL